MRARPRGEDPGLATGPEQVGKRLRPEQVVKLLQGGEEASVFPGLPEFRAFGVLRKETWSRTGAGGGAGGRGRGRGPGRGRAGAEAGRGLRKWGPPPEPGKSHKHIIK